MAVFGGNARGANKAQMLEGLLAQDRAARPGRGLLGSNGRAAMLSDIVEGDQPPIQLPNPFNPSQPMDMPILRGRQGGGGFGRMAPDDQFPQAGPAGTAMASGAPPALPVLPPMPAELPGLPAMGGGETPFSPARAMGAPLPQQGGGFGGSPMAAQNGAPRFDYEALRNAMLPPEKQHSKTHNTLMDILRVGAPALMALGGNAAGANAFIQNQQAQKQAKAAREFEVNKMLADWQYKDFSRRDEHNLDAAAPYTLGQGQSRYAYNPLTGTNAQIAHEQPTFEEYADTLNLKPGTEEYFNAVEDYVLRGNGPTAFGFDKQLDDARTGNDIKLEGVRQTGRERVKAQPTYRDTHPTQPAARGGGGGRSRGGAPTATGPNGEKVMWNGSAWVPAK